MIDDILSVTSVAGNGIKEVVNLIDPLDGREEFFRSFTEMDCRTTGGIIITFPVGSSPPKNVIQQGIIIFRKRLHRRHRIRKR